MPQLLDPIVAERGSDLALADEHGTRTWAELAERVTRLMNGLEAAGVAPGDTVALMLGNRREVFEVFWAAAHLGFTYVPVNWHWVGDELAFVLDDADAVALITEARFADAVNEALADERSGRVRQALVVGHADSDITDGTGPGLRRLRGRRLGGPHRAGGDGRPDVLHLGHHGSPQGRPRCAVRR